MCINVGKLDAFKWGIINCGKGLLCTNCSARWSYSDQPCRQDRLVSEMAQITKLRIFQSSVFHCADKIYTKEREKMSHNPVNLSKQDSLCHSIQKCWSATRCSGKSRCWNPEDLGSNTLSLSIYFSAEIIGKNRKNTRVPGLSDWKRAPSKGLMNGHDDSKHATAHQHSLPMDTASGSYGIPRSLKRAMTSHLVGGEAE